ncbi:8457_t:CDS:2 [Diversispora eburnea]|uniref:Nucleoside diphosphate kinase n=1 Tax=Diversispora eburnea TaxID=1213867 RepID=A0A9N9F557_9GLOM|nr:8457_t:CDS:2 [Diversispora eburnea]
MTLLKNQLSLALLKPDLCANPAIIHKLFELFRKDQFEIVKERKILWSKSQAEQFYFEHRNRFFYERLCGYMASGPFVALIISKPNAIKDWRDLIGPTHPCRARINASNTLRSLYGLTDTRNSFHGSDSEETAKREIKFFFPDFKF